MTAERTDAQTITEHELEQCERANQTGRTPVVFVHGLWLLPAAGTARPALLEDNGYVALTPGWRADFAPLFLLTSSPTGAHAAGHTNAALDRSSPGRRPLDAHGAAWSWAFASLEPGCRRHVV
jgi:hypothetical protein